MKFVLKQIRMDLADKTPSLKDFNPNKESDTADKNNNETERSGVLQPTYINIGKPNSEASINGNTEQNSQTATVENTPNTEELVNRTIDEIKQDSVSNETFEQIQELVNKPMKGFSDDKISNIDIEKAEKLEELVNKNIEGFEDITPNTNNTGNISETELQTRDNTVSTLESEISDTYAFLFGEDISFSDLNGDEIKEQITTKFSESTLAKLAYVKQDSANMMQQAHEGNLTVEDCYNNAKSTLLAIFPDADIMSDSLKSDYEAKINTL